MKLLYYLILLILFGSLGCTTQPISIKSTDILLTQVQPIENLNLPPGHPGVCYFWDEGDPITPYEMMRAYAGIYKITCTANPPACGPDTGLAPPPTPWHSGWASFNWFDGQGCDYDEPILAGVKSFVVNGKESTIWNQGFPNTEDGGCGRDFSRDYTGDKDYSYYDYIADEGQGVVLIYPVDTEHSGDGWLKYRYKKAIKRPTYFGNVLILQELILIDGSYADPHEEIIPVTCSAERIWEPDEGDSKWTQFPHYYYVFFESHFTQ